MWSYIARRLLYAVPILLGVSMLVFALIHLAPGDVVDLLVPPEVPRDVADALRRRFALDQPIYVQYFAWLGRLLVGDLGISFFNNRPVAEELFSALGNTLMLALPATVLGFGLGVLLGALAAFNRGTWLDKAGTLGPALHTLEILSHEFVSTLHAKGLMSRRVLYHVMKNAAPSALALMGLQFGYLLGGSILVETVFNWPGSGGLMNLAIFRRDIPVLSATILVLAAIFVVINILVDVLQALIDPRMRR